MAKDKVTPFEDRVKNANKELEDIIKRYDLRLVVIPGINPEGRAIASAQWADATEDKKVETP